MKVMLQSSWQQRRRQRRATRRFLLLWCKKKMNWRIGKTPYRAARRAVCRAPVRAMRWDADAMRWRNRFLDILKHFKLSINIIRNICCSHFSIYFTRWSIVITILHFGGALVSSNALREYPGCCFTAIYKTHFWMLCACQYLYVKALLFNFLIFFS